MVHQIEHVYAIATWAGALDPTYPLFEAGWILRKVDVDHTLGFESVDARDPSKCVGFDIDLGEAIGVLQCIVLCRRAMPCDHKARDAEQRFFRVEDKSPQSMCRKTLAALWKL